MSISYVTNLPSLYLVWSHHYPLIYWLATCSIFPQLRKVFLQNLPKMCVLWVCLSASEMAGKRLGASSFSKFSHPPPEASHLQRLGLHTRPPSRKILDTAPSYAYLIVTPLAMKCRRVHCRQSQMFEICDLCQKNRDVSKMKNLFYCIEQHFTSFNLVPGSSILDNYFQNYVILKKQQLSTPIVFEKIGIKA
jgi:hypothetical protein